MKKYILVCGGAGYIGSHMVFRLIEDGRNVIVFDNLQSGNKPAIHKNAIFIHGDIRNYMALDDLFEKYNIEGVIHFGADSIVPESIVNPLKYFNNNVYGLEILLKAMVKHNINNIIFSSTAAVYGQPEEIPILETSQTLPINPYGESKLIMEKMIKWVSVAHDLRYVSLRYFNVAGANLDGKIGEFHRPETHLIPIVLQVPLKQREIVSIFGDDYDTPDGTCVRDYIHVLDIVDAHVLALKYLQNGGANDIFNLSNGNGFSVKEVIKVAQQVVGKEIKTEIKERRPADPSQLIACSSKAQSVLGWKPKHPSLESIISTAWAWHSTHLNGFQ
jgi:UDP-glucose 4-epimerase